MGGGEDHIIFVCSLRTNKALVLGLSDVGGWGQRILIVFVAFLYPLNIDPLRIKTKHYSFFPWLLGSRPTFHDSHYKRESSTCQNVLASVWSFVCSEDFLKSLKTFIYLKETPDELMI